MTTAEARRLSRLLFDARELIDMWGDVMEVDGVNPAHPRKIRDEIDAYRAEQGWSPHGFGGEVGDE